MTECQEPRAWGIWRADGRFSRAYDSSVVASSCAERWSRLYGQQFTVVPLYAVHICAGHVGPVAWGVFDAEGVLSTTRMTEASARQAAQELHELDANFDVEEQLLPRRDFYVAPLFVESVAPGAREETPR